MPEDIQSLEISIYNLITRFIKRQQITLDAFRALRPAVVDAVLINCDEQQLINILNQYIEAPWKGHWHEWAYYFQGTGCRLINSQTSEIIEWEVSNIHSFDRYWFVNWLEWLWIFHSEDSGLRMLQDYFVAMPNRHDLYEIIFPMLKVLTMDGYITNDPAHKNIFALVEDVPDTHIA